MNHTAPTRTEHAEQRASALAHLRQARQTLALLSDHDTGGPIRTADTLTHEDMLYRQIGENIQRERRSLGFNQIELAAEIGMTRTSVVNIEAGRQRLPIHTLYAIADALGVSLACLLPDNVKGTQP